MSNTPSAPGSSSPANTAAATPATDANAVATSANPGAATQVKATPAEVRKFKLKADNREVELSEAELIKHAQLGLSSSSRFQEAAQMRKMAEQVLELAQKDPGEVFRRLGVNAREWAERHLLSEIQRESMTPEQKAHAAAQSELATMKKAAAEHKAMEERRQMDDMTGKHAAHFDKLFTESLMRLGEQGIKPTPAVTKRMASLARTALRQGHPIDQDTSDALAKMVIEDVKSDLQQIIAGQSGEVIESLLGESGWKSLSKRKLSLLKQKPQSFSTLPSERSKSTSQSAGAKLSWRDLQKRTRGSKGPG